MKTIYLIPIVLLFLTSCTTDDHSNDSFIEPVFNDNPASVLTVDIIYVYPSNELIINGYDLNEANFIKDLNGCYFHRHDIGLILGEKRFVRNDELYNLRDNIGSETQTFLEETQDSYRRDRLNIYIIPRSNTVAIAGIGKSLRALITDDFLNDSTSPHEIGHALGLYHIEEENNIMCKNKSSSRKNFNDRQVDIMRRCISSMR